MIPEFPEFKHLELSDREEIERITKQFPPYSDFHFITIFCWDIDDTTLISTLNDNLIIKQIDCLTCEQSFSFIGINSVPKTIKNISTFLYQNKLPLTLRWVPEVTINYLDGIKVIISEDNDYFDYIYNVNCNFKAKGGKYLNYRRDISRFERNYNNISVKQLDLANDLVKNQLNEIFFKWSENKEIRNKYCEPSIEIKALNKLISSVSQFEFLVCLGVYSLDKLIGFSINELPDRQFGSALFFKADTNYRDIYQFLWKSNIELYNKLSIKYLNAESDLGLESLKKYKLSRRPEFFLKKYKIEIFL